MFVGELAQALDMKAPDFLSIYFYPAANSFYWLVKLSLPFSTSSNCIISRALVITSKTCGWVVDDSCGSNDDDVGEVENKDLGIMKAWGSDTDFREAKLPSAVREMEFSFSTIFVLNEGWFMVYFLFLEVPIAMICIWSKSLVQEIWKKNSSFSFPVFTFLSLLNKLNWGFCGIT